jgi:hypothetical protein
MTVFLLGRLEIVTQTPICLAQVMHVLPTGICANLQSPGQVRWRWCHWRGPQPLTLQKAPNDQTILLTLTQIGVELVRHHPDRTV